MRPNYPEDLGGSESQKVGSPKKCSPVFRVLIFFIQQLHQKKIHPTLPYRITKRDPA